MVGFNACKQIFFLLLRSWVIAMRLRTEYTKCLTATGESELPNLLIRIKKKMCYRKGNAGIMRTFKRDLMN